MDLRHLHHFNTLAETGSLHRAARRLGLRQPALSQSIRALEADVGTRLVERGPTGSRLTRAGVAFLTEVRSILSALDRAVRIARLAAASASPLRLGIVEDVATFPVATALQAFQRSFPDNRIIVGGIAAGQHWLMLDREMLDLVIFPEDAATDRDNIEILWPVDLHVAVPASHPSAGSAIIDVGDLRDVPLIVGASDHFSAPDRILTNACRAAGIDPLIVAIAGHLEIRLLMVAAGFGLAVLPSDPALITAVGIVNRPLRPPLHMKVAAGWPPSGLTPEARCFLDLARRIKISAPMADNVVNNGSR